MIHLVCLSEGKELPRFQHFRSTKTSNKFLNAWGKIIMQRHYKMKICGLHVWKGYIYKKFTSYDSLSQKYRTSVQVLIALNGIVFLLVKL